MTTSLSETIITFAPDQSTASFEVSIEDDNDVQETRELRLSLVPLDSNSISGTVSETVITIEDDELEISLRTLNEAGCNPGASPRCQVNVNENEGPVTLQLDASRLTVRPSLTVNLLYTADVGALTGEHSSADVFTTITMDTDTTTRRTFDVEVIDDQIVEEVPRTAQVVLQPGVGYTVDPGNTSVAVTVTDDNDSVADVYFSQSTGTVTEGQPIEFIITQDLIAATETSVDIKFEYMGDFFTTTPLTTTTPVNFPARSFMAKITIPTDDDDDAEANGSLKATIVVSSESGSILRLGTPAVRTVTILNDDAFTAISFERSEYTISEDTTGTIILVADPPPEAKAQISLTTLLSETTILDEHYELSTTTVVFNPGQSTASFVVNILDDKVVQSTRKLSLSIDPLNKNATLGTTPMTVISIGNNDMSSASLGVVGDATLLEGGDNATLRVTLSNVFDRETTIQIVIEGGTATRDDYTIIGDPVTLPANSTYAESTLKIIDDFEVEPAETIILTLEADHNEQIIGLGAPTTLTIVDNDVPAISFARAGYDISEGTTRTITLVADQPPVVDTRIKLTTTTTTFSRVIAEDDYELSPATVIFGFGENTASFVVEIFDDGDDVVVQSTRELSLDFEVPDNNAKPGSTPKTVISVRDNDVSIASLEVVGNDTLLEGRDNATLRVTLSNVFDRETTIQIVIKEVPQTADRDDDYTIDDNPVTLPAGSMYVERTLTIIDDDLVEPAETIILTLEAGHNEQIITGNESSATLTIADDDVPAISFDPAVYTIVEGTTRTITLVADQSPVVETRIMLTTGLETTIEDGDYTLSPETVIFNSGENTASFVVKIRDDEDIQATRKLFVSFMPFITGSITRGANSTATITIQDNSAPIAGLEIMGSGLRLTEGEDSTLRVTLDRAFGEVTDIQIETDGTAIQGVDYTIDDNPVTFPVDSTFVETQLRIRDDGDNQESDETIRLTLDAVSNLIIDDGPGAQLTLTIEGNEPEISLRTLDSSIMCRPPSPPGSTPCGISVPESGGSVTLQLDANRLTASPLTVNLLYTADAGALDGGLPSDSTDSFTTVTVPTDTTTRHTFQVDVTDDKIAAEGTRRAQVVLQGGDGYTVDPNNTTVAVAVTDDDDASVSFSQSTGTVTEGQDIVFIITKDLIAATETSVNITFTPMGNFFTMTPLTMTTPVNFPAGGVVMSTAKIVIQTMDDKDIETDGSLTAAIDITGSLLLAGNPNERTVMILDNDVPAAISFGLAEYTITEGTTGTITLAAEPSPLVKIQIELTTLTRTTVPAGEYSLSTTIVTFEADQPTASFEVSIPARIGPQETQELHLSFNLRDTTNSTRGDVFETVINVEDNLAPIASLGVMGVVGDDIRFAEGDSPTLQVTLDRAFGEVTDIRIETEGTATPGVDYTITVNPVTFPVGSTSVETQLMIHEDDNNQEADETIILTLAAVNEQIIDIDPDARLTLTIGVNEPPEISLRTLNGTCNPGANPGCQVDVNENVGFVPLQLEASRLTTMSLTVNLRYTADVGALTGELPSDDMQEMSTMITMATDTTTRHTFQVPVTDDKIAAEFERTAHVMLQGGDDYTVSDTNNTVAVAVQDNDVASVRFSQSTGTVTEGQPIEFIIIKDLIAATETSVNIEFEYMGNFFTTTPLTTTTPVNFPAGGVVMSMAKITIPTMDDKNIEDDGSLKAAIGTGSLLQPSTPTESTVTILSDDVPAAISFESG